MSIVLQGSRVARRRTRAIITTAAALTAAAALAAPAGAAVNGAHVVAVIPDASALELSGYKAGDVLTVNVVRNGVVVGTASDTATQDPRAAPNDPNGGILNVNGGGLPCWTGPTPQILPGDTVTVDNGSVTDSMQIQQIEATTIGRDPLTGDVLVHGFAIAPGGGRFDQATFDASVQARITISAGQLFSNGRNTVRAGATKTDGTIAYDEPTATDPAPTTWTADFPMTAHDATLAMANKDMEGVFTVGVSELTIGRTPVTAGGCPAPVDNSVTSFDRPAVNAANAATPLKVSGVAQPDATNVGVVISDTAGHKVTVPDVVPANGSFTTAGVNVSGLSDGTLTATPTFTVPGQPPFVGATLTIRKDVVVPLAPVASPSGGTLSATKGVTLDDDDQTAKIHYTLAGTTPSAASPVYGSAIPVDHSLTIRAIAIDAAGNTSPEAAFRFTFVAAAPVAPASGPNTTTIIQQVPFVLPILVPGRGVAGSQVSSPARPAVRGLSVAVLRGHALRVSLRVGAGAKVVRLRVLRAGGGAPVLTAVRSTSGRGRVTITLSGRALRALKRGSYVLEARAGASRTALGTATRKAFRIG